MKKLQRGEEEEEEEEEKRRGGRRERDRGKVGGREWQKEARVIGRARGRSFFRGEHLPRSVYAVADHRLAAAADVPWTKKDRIREKDRAGTKDKDNEYLCAPRWDKFHDAIASH